MYQMYHKIYTSLSCASARAPPRSEARARLRGALLLLQKSWYIWYMAFFRPSATLKAVFCTRYFWYIPGTQLVQPGYRPKSVYFCGHFRCKAFISSPYGMPSSTELVAAGGIPTIFRLSPANSSFRVLISSAVRLSPVKMSKAK